MTDVDPFPASDETTLVEAAQRMLPSTPIISVQRLIEEDLYWYSHHTKRPLPVLKVIFADIAGLTDRSARTYRWLFNFFHDYDLPVLLNNRPARDALIWLLSIAGLVVSVSGVVLGYRALRRRCP